MLAMLMLQPAVADILSNLSSGSWSERQDGLILLQTFLQSHHQLSSVQLLSDYVGFINVEFYKLK